MGQRHQIYLAVQNPAKVGSSTELKNAFKDFKSDKIILPFHNQWLYGRSALLSAYNVLSHTSKVSVNDKIGKTTDNYSTPFSIGGQRHNFATKGLYISAITNIMNYVNDVNPATNVGFLTSYYLGDESVDYCFDYTLGDNNDGVTIIDTVNNRYCFMNIDDYDRSYMKPGELHYDILDRAPFTPLSAHEYVTAYYGETEETLNPYHLKGRKADVLLKKHIRDNNFFVRKLNKFEVMTMEQVKELFPKMAPRKPVTV